MHCFYGMKFGVLSFAYLVGLTCLLTIGICVGLHSGATGSDN